MTHAEFVRRRKGYERRVEQDWHKTRVLISWLTAPHMAKGKTLRPEEIIKLPMDSKKAAVFDKETLEALKKFMNNK